VWWCVVKCCSIVMVLVIRCPALLGDNMALLFICILILSHSFIFFRLYFFYQRTYGCIPVQYWNLCFFVVMSMYSYCMFMYLHRASWHSSATLTEVFPCFFLSCKANARVKPAKTGHGPHSSNIVVLFCVLFVLCRSVYCVCVNVYCTTATGWLSNCSCQIYNMSTEL